MRTDSPEKVLEKLATNDKATIVIESQSDGEMRVTSGSWDGEKVILRDQVLEVRTFRCGACWLRWLSVECVPKEDEMTQTIEEKNKAFVLEAFETLFNKRDYAAAEHFWSPNYIQHSAHIPPGREGLFALVKGIPDSLHYENGLTVANGDHVLLHGRFSGMGLPANWIVVDIVRLENGVLAEHWDVIEDEATRETSVSGLPMFGPAFPLE
jgi:predicted SnoaL-like aldol condensation-catalyzing enzyme